MPNARWFDKVAINYDGDGTRISKTQNQVKRKYINDVALPLVGVLMETNNSGIIQASYTYGQGLISMTRAGVNSYYHYDGLGTVKQMTDNSGTVVANYTYDSFGNLIASSGTTTNPYGFTGQQQFGEADSLVFLRARYYSSSIGRFLSRDPIGYIDGWNLYMYAKNNPINIVDPRGLLGYSPFPGNPPIPMQPSCIGVSEEEYNREARNPDDYMRHCLVSCRITKRMGSLCAWAAGWWNELRPGRSGGAGRREDTHNNSIGRGCASESDGCDKDKKYNSCEECCEGKRGT